LEFIGKNNPRSLPLDSFIRYSIGSMKLPKFLQRFPQKYERRASGIIVPFNTRQDYESKNIFRKYAHLVTWFANTHLGRDYLSIPNSLGKIVKLSPNSFHEYLGQPTKDTIAIQGRFYTFDRYYEKLGLALETIDNVLNYIENFDRAKEALAYYLGLRHTYGLPRLLYTVGTFNPNTGEGRIDRGNDATWAECRDAAIGSSTSANVMIYIDDTFYLVRGFLPFDTSSIGAGSTITPAPSITCFAYITPEGRWCSFTSTPSTLSVWPALLPP